MKRFILILLIATFVLSGCMPGSAPSGSSDPSTDPAPSQETNLQYDGTPVTISFAHTFSSRYNDLLDRCIAEFTALYPTITVEHQNYGTVQDIREIVFTLKGNASYPNLVVCQSAQAEDYRTLGIALQLDDFLGNSTQASSIHSEFLHSCRSSTDSITYSLPLTRYGYVLYYNSDFFTANALTVPATMGELEDVCRQIKEIDENSIPLYVQSPDKWYLHQLNQLGLNIAIEEDIFSADTALSLADEMGQWVKLGYADLSISGNAGPNFNTSHGDPLCYMVISSSVSPGYFYSGFHVGIAHLPQSDTSQTPSMLTNGTDLCILKSENVQENLAAWLLMEYLSCNAGFQAELATMGCTIPVSECACDTDIYRSYMSETHGKAGLCAQMAQFYQQSCIFVPISELCQQNSTQDRICNMLYSAAGSSE